MILLASDLNSPGWPVTRNGARKALCVPSSKALAGLRRNVHVNLNVLIACSLTHFAASLAEERGARSFAAV